MKNIAIIILITMSTNIFGQNTMIIDGGNLKVNGNVSIVLKNTKFINNSTFQAGSGTIVVYGDATNANAAIGGSSLTTFYNLEINKTANGTQLGNDVNISNQLTLTNGNIDLSDYDLTIQNTGSLSGGSSNSYLKTSSLGTVIQEVSGSNIVFPIGNQSYTPLTLNNAGTTDDFNARVENVVYENGTSGNALTTDVVNATWYIDEATSGGSNITATFQWNAADELTNFDRTQSFVSVYHTSMWNNGTQQTAFGTNPYLVSESGITTFSPFTIASDANVLPVELLYFYGEQQGENVLLNWETATEINNDYFDVEFSLDGINFEKIGQVKGAGTTLENQSYEFLHDVSNLTGLQDLSGFYYRLKQVDFDKKYEYTNIINIQTIEQSNIKTLNIFPNPVRNELTIENGKGIIIIYNSLGQIIQQSTMNNEQWTMNITDWENGIYTLKLQKTNGTLISKQFVKL